MFVIKLFPPVLPLCKLSFYRNVPPTWFYWNCPTSWMALVNWLPQNCTTLPLPPLPLPPLPFPPLPFPPLPCYPHGYCHHRRQDVVEAPSRRLWLYLGRNFRDGSWSRDSGLGSSRHLEWALLGRIRPLCRLPRATRRKTLSGNENLSRKSREGTLRKRPSLPQCFPMLGYVSQKLDGVQSGELPTNCYFRQARCVHL